MVKYWRLASIFSLMPALLLATTCIGGAERLPIPLTTGRLIQGHRHPRVANVVISGRDCIGIGIVDVGVRPSGPRFRFIQAAAPTAAFSIAASPVEPQDSEAVSPPPAARRRTPPTGR